MTSTIRETSVVTTPVIEGATVESELVRRDITHEEPVDVDREVIDRIQVYADIDRADSAKLDFTASNHVVNEAVTETIRSGAGGTSLTGDDVGKSRNRHR